jgi:hypothetical protein
MSSSPKLAGERFVARQKALQTVQINLFQDLTYLLSMFSSQNFLKQALYLGNLALPLQVDLSANLLISFDGLKYAKAFSSLKTNGGFP